MVNVFLINNIIILLTWVLLLFCCYTDIRYRIISNAVVIIIMGLAALNFLFGCGVLNYMAAGIFFVFGLLLFSFRLFGAGDIKLIVALLLSVPSHYVLFFLVMITIVGLPMAIFALIYKSVTKKQTTLPYGVAISASYILTSVMLFEGVIDRF